MCLTVLLADLIIIASNNVKKKIRVNKMLQNKTENFGLTKSCSRTVLDFLDPSLYDTSMNVELSG